MIESLIKDGKIALVVALVNKLLEQIGKSSNTVTYGKKQVFTASNMGAVEKLLVLEDLVRDDNLVFAATGITHGELLKGISRRGNLATTETLLIRGKSRTIRKIQSIHYLDRKDSEIYEILRN